MKQMFNLSEDSCEKLVPNLQDKTDYVCDIHNLKYYLEQGLRVTKVSKVITYTQSA